MGGGGSSKLRKLGREEKTEKVLEQRQIYYKTKESSPFGDRKEEHRGKNQELFGKIGDFISL